jgi:serine/threonine-protein kinase
VAPEQVVHTHPPDRRTDIYSLGAVAYFLLTGRPPFSGDNAMAVMIAHTRDPVTPPSEIRAGIPPDLEQVVLRCLSKKPEDRYPDTMSLAEALEACADAGNWSPRHAEEWWAKHKDVLARAPQAAQPTILESDSSTDAMGRSSRATVLHAVEARRSM